MTATGHPWISAVKNHLCDPNNEDTQQLFDELGKEFKKAEEERKFFMKRPVSIPHNFETNNELVNAVKNLAEGNRPFGFSGWLGKSEEKKALASVQILSNSVKSTCDWKHVKKYLSLQKHLRELVLRWNQLARELEFPVLEITDQSGLEAIKFFAIYENIKRELKLEQEISQKGSAIFTSWIDVENVITDQNTLEEFDRALRHHLKKNRLANVWDQKSQFQKVLCKCSGPVVEAIRSFVNQELGNSAISDSKIQARWSELMEELSRVIELRTKLDTVQKVTDLICQSGAPKYVKLLREPSQNTTIDDSL